MNPDHTDDSYPEKLVAFLDILGFKELILQDKPKALKSISLIDDRIRHVLNVLYENYGKIFSTKLFSDCICLSCEYTFENIFYILYELAFIQFYLSINGIFLKGALSRGKHFENDIMIFSEGLIRAYELEQAAIYPRIIIDKELIYQIKEDHQSYFPIYIGFTKTDFLIQSPDGRYIVDYLNMLYEEGMDQHGELECHKNIIVEQIKDNFSDSNIIGKYQWLSEYHNYKAKEIIGEPEDWDEGYFEELSEKLIIPISLFPKFDKGFLNFR